jgi:hypothetical protein
VCCMYVRCYPASCNNTPSMFDITGAELLVILGATFVLGKRCWFWVMRLLGYMIRNSEDTAPEPMEIKRVELGTLTASLSCGPQYVCLSCRARSVSKCLVHR